MAARRLGRTFRRRAGEASRAGLPINLSYAPYPRYPQAWSQRFRFARLGTVSQFPLVIGTDVPASPERRKRQEGEERTEGPISAGRRWKPWFEAELLFGAMTQRTAKDFRTSRSEAPEELVPAIARAVSPQGIKPRERGPAQEGRGIPGRFEGLRTGRAKRTGSFQTSLETGGSGREARHLREPLWGEANLSWCARIEEQETFGSPS